jgi:cohesin loading factor subunit SCC2
MESDGNITVSKKISGDQDGDATLFGGVLTSHANRLFQMTKSRESKTRLAVLQVLALLLRQGLVNPNEAVPHLFALQGDVENNAIRSLAHQLLSLEGEKRPDTLRRRICAGVKHAFELQNAIATTDGRVSATFLVKKGKSSGAGVECIFSSVFRGCIANNRKQRHGFFKNLLGLFKANIASKVSKTGELDLGLLSFVSQILAHLDYRTSDDPLFIIHEISSMVTLQGSDTLDQLAAILRPAGLSNTDECGDDNSSENALELAARSKFPNRTKDARPLSSKDFNLPAFVAHCRHGMALCLLLRLKTFLRRVYNLSETRCLEYDPSNSERICDKASVNVDISTLFDASVPRVLATAGIGPVDKDALIRQYAEFRRLMREENSAALMLRSDSEDEGGLPTASDTPRKVDD